MRKSSLSAVLVAAKAVEPIHVSVPLVMTRTGLIDEKATIAAAEKKFQQMDAAYKRVLAQK